MAPEQWVDAHDVDARTDIFAFGVCLYEMFCGRRPYTIATGKRQEAPAPAQVRGDATLPERLGRLLTQCVAWDWEGRPESMQAVRQELCAIYEECFGQSSVFATLPDLSLKADGFNNRGVSYIELGREDEARKSWQAALQESPQHSEATFNLGYLRWRKGEIPDDVYVTQLRALERGQGTDPNYWRCLAWIHLERGDIEAVEQIQQSEHRIEEEGFKSACVDPERPMGRLFCTLKGHTREVQSVSFSPDGRYVVSVGTDKTVRLWEVTSGQAVHTFAGHSGHIHSVSFSPDGRYVVSVGEDGTVRIWEVASGQAVRTFTDHTERIWSVSFSPNGRYVVSGEGLGTVRLWEVASGQTVHTFVGHTDNVMSVSYSPDGRYVVSGSWDKTVRVWEVTSGQEVRTFSGHTGRVWSVSYAPDGRYVVSGGEDKTIRLWEVANGQAVRTFTGHTECISSVSYSPDGRYVVSSSWDKTVRVWEVASGQAIHTFTGHADKVWSVSYASDGRYVVSGGDRTIRLWEMASGREACSFVMQGVKLVPLHS